MKTETKRITLLFASFNVSYLCRLIYEFLLGKKYYTAIIQERFARRIVGALMPLIFDLTSEMDMSDVTTESLARRVVQVDEWIFTRFGYARVPTC